MYYVDYFLIGQIIEASIPPENIDTYVCKEREVKLVRPKYDVSSGEFLGLHETVGFTVVRGDDDELFLNYGFNKEKLKVLYSHYRRLTPNSFGGTIFNHHRQMVESGELESEYSEFYFFFFFFFYIRLRTRHKR